MRDTIYRDEAIEAIDKRIYALMKDPEYRKKGSHIDLYGAKELLRELPSADRWIPCSERLPERDGDYLATLHHKWPDREYKTVEIEEFRNGGFDENKYIKVVAWTPKPAPWEGEEND